MWALFSWSAIVAMAVVATSLYGVVHYFSPIPFEDQWDAYVGFFHSLSDGNLMAWWTPQMEHRIIFSRALFWLDGHLFGGSNVFTIVSNLLLLSAVSIVIARQAYKSGLPKSEWYTATFITIGFMWSWTQFENFTSGFQNQFIAVYLFALLAFAQYAKADSRFWKLAVAVGWCLLSSLSMANGLLALIVMAIQGLLLRRPLQEILSFVVLGTVIAWIYLHGESAPPLTISDQARTTSLFRLRFFLVFLGSPFYYLRPSNFLAGAVGFLTLAFAAVTILRLYISRSVTPYRSFLIASYGFIVAAGLGATRGRWMLGFDAATASRYTTPTLIALSLLLLLAVDVFKKYRIRTLAVSTIVLTILLPIQGFALGYRTGMSHFAREDLFSWKLAVLGQKIGFDRPDLDAMIFPPSAHARYMVQADYAASNNIGPYGSGWLHDAGIVKYDPTLRDDSLCTGHLDGVSQGVANGWVLAKQFKPDSILIVLAHKGQTVGYGVTGEMRTDVRAAFAGAPRDSGWRGFTSDNEIEAYAYVGGKFCRVSRE